MASNNIKGITIELNGDTSKLGKAIDKVTKNSVELSRELKQVERGLKFNPGNSELVRQQQELLQKTIEQTANKLDILKQAQSQVEKQFADNKINAEQYREFQRELVSTEGAMEGLRNKMERLQQEQQNMETQTKGLNTLLSAQGKTIDDYADALGDRLVNSIKKGTASSKQLETAIQKIGQESLGSKVDVEKLQKTLHDVDKTDLNKVKKELGQLADEAKKAEKETKSLKENLQSFAAGAGTIGIGVTGAAQMALDFSELDTIIDVSFNVDDSAKEVIKETAREMEAYGLDANESLEGLRRQWALNKDASDEANASIIKGAGAISKAYAGIDFIELVQETNEIGAAIGVTNEKALALTNYLLKAGFPPEQLDTISEYGQQMKDAGFSAKEIQHIFEKGIDTKTWNIDNLNDGVKEARIKVAEMGMGLSKTMSDEIIPALGLSTEKYNEFLELSSKKTKELTEAERLRLADLGREAGSLGDQFIAWGDAVAKGGEGGSKAMAEVVDYLANVEDKTLQNALAVEIFGTKWEDQGQNLISVFQGIDQAQDKTKQNTDGLAESVKKIDESPAVRFKQAISDLKVAFEPFLSVLANVIAKIAEWVSNNPEIAAGLAGIVAGFATLVAGILAIIPVITAVTTAFGTFGKILPLVSGSLGAISVPVAAVVAGIGLLVAAVVGIFKYYQQWKTESDNLGKGIGDFATDVLAKFGEMLSSLVQAIVDFLPDFVEKVIEIVTTFIKTISDNLPKILEKGGEILTTLIKGIIKILPKLITAALKLMTELIKAIVKNLPEILKKGSEIVWTLIKGIVKVAFEVGKTIVTDVIPQIVDNLKEVDLLEVGKDIIRGLIKGIWSMVGETGRKVKEMAGNVKDWFAEKLRINSPSRVFTELGQYTMEGFQVGFDKTGNNAIKDVVNTAGAIADGFKKSMRNANLQKNIPITAKADINGGYGVQGVRNNQPMQMQSNKADINLYLADTVIGKISVDYINKKTKVEGRSILKADLI